MKITSKMLSRAVIAFRQSDEDLLELRLRDALTYALAGVPDSPDDRLLQELIAQFRVMLDDARRALEKLQLKLLALTALGAPSVDDAVLVDEQEPPA